jgi:N-acetylglucosaminyl-diphospho-decaprenol L-rhamnosyltransferase
MLTLSLSVVSHGQPELISRLLSDLRYLAPTNVELFITVNIPENEMNYNSLPFPTYIIRNKVPQGFGANHNAAFSLSSGYFFVVLNPDIRLYSFDVEKLIGPLRDPRVGALAPRVINGKGEVEDSIRFFPTLFKYIQRVILNQRNPDYLWGLRPFEVEWAAGMFLVFKKEAFESIKGFDSNRFFMYLEDVDICQRLRKSEWTVIANPDFTVTHDAQRASRKSLKHLRWHALSALRYLSGL